MSERFAMAQTAEIKGVHLDTPETEQHDRELAEEFGRIIMDGYSADFVAPFGADLVEEHLGAEDPSERDLSIVAAMGEKSKTWHLTVDK